MVKRSNRRNANEDMKGAVLCPKCYPKDTSHKMLKNVFNETCKEKFKHTLKTKEFIIVYHKPDNIRKLIKPSSLKQCEGTENIANYHADEAGISTMNKEIDM